MSEADAAAVDVVRSYHSQTSHGGHHDRSSLLRFRPLDPTNRPDPFKRYPGLPISPVTDADYLYYTAGVTRVSETSYFRAAMSAGNLHPVELYVVGSDLSVHHYAPLEHGLTTLRAGRGGESPAWVVLTGIPWRTAWKYGERGWRHLYWDSGAMAANLLALRPDAVVGLQFDDSAVAALLGIDNVSEFPLAVIRLGDGELETDVEPIHPAVAPISARPIEFPLITAVQHATEENRGRLPPSGVENRPNLSSQTIEELILRRGSTRLFRHETVPESALREPMRLATEGAPLIEHYVSPHSVEGVTNQPREIAQHLTYDQPLGGDSAYTVFHAADLDTVLAEYGARGYRAAQFQAGFAAERLELAAFSIGLGATGLTFYDDEVQQVFSTSSACMLVTAVGVPDYTSRPGGKPGEPTALTGFDDLMGRLQLRMMQRRSASP